jgi:type II secretory pathway pseudopilin PulG
MLSIGVILCTHQHQSIDGETHPFRKEKQKMKHKRNRQAGFAILLELLVAGLVSTTLLCMATVNVVQVRASQNQTDAKTRLRTVAQAQTAIALCHAQVGCVPSVGIIHAVPPVGTILQEGYSYTMTTDPTSGEWWLTASPVAVGFSGTQTYFIDDTGVLRCGLSSSSPPCQ